MEPYGNGIALVPQHQLNIVLSVYIAVLETVLLKHSYRADDCSANAGTHTSVLYTNSANKPASLEHI